MATATPGPTPNPNAMKFTLDTTLGEMINADVAQGSDDPFAAAVLELPGVANLFGVNDFVTVTRREGAEWDPIVAGVQAAAAEYL
jgi:Scaffold protein Nfu/NifU N terminal